MCKQRKLIDYYCIIYYNTYNIQTINTNDTF